MESDRPHLRDIAAAIVRVNPFLSADELSAALNIPHEEADRLLNALDAEATTCLEKEAALTRRFIRAVRHADPTAVRECLREGFDVNLPLRRPHEEPITPLLYACISSEMRDCEQDADIVRQLLTAGADPNTRDAQGDTPLMYVSAPAIIRHLLNAGADATLRGSFQRSVLHYPDRFDHAEAVRLLLSADAPADAIDVNGCSTLFCKISGLNTERSDILSLLLASGAPPEHRDNQGYTALEAALADNFYPYAALLLRHNAPVAPNALSDFLTRELTADEGKEEVLKALLQQRIGGESS